MSNLISIIVVFLAGILIYGFRRRILQPLRRFEARNARRRAEEARALFDKHAHYRQTVQCGSRRSSKKRANSTRIWIASISPVATASAPRWRILRPIGPGTTPEIAK
jgi:hypothetical protein